MTSLHVQIKRENIWTAEEHNAQEAQMQRSP